MIYIGLKRYIIQQIIRFLRAVLKANFDDRIVIQDMEGNKLKPDTEIAVFAPEQWDRKVLPVVIVEVSSLLTSFGGIAKGFADEERQENNPAIHTFLFPTEETLSLEIFARSTDERDKLTDIVGFIFMNPDTLDYFFKRKIRIVSSPELIGFREESPPGQDFKIYASEISVKLNTECIIREELTGYATIADVVAETYMEN